MAPIAWATEGLEHLGVTVGGHLRLHVVAKVLQDLTRGDIFSGRQQ